MKKMLAIVILLAAHGLVAQQDPRGTIAGRVSDGSGALVPNVDIRTINTETNVTATARSNSQGMFEIPFLQSGIYRVEAEQAGFKKWSRSQIELRVRDLPPGGRRA